MSEQLSNSEMNTDTIILLDVPNFYFKFGFISVELVIFVTKEKNMVQDWIQDYTQYLITITF